MTPREALPLEQKRAAREPSRAALPFSRPIARDVLTEIAEANRDGGWGFYEWFSYNFV